MRRFYSTHLSNYTTGVQPVCANNIIHRTPLKKVATTGDIAMQILVLASSTVSGHITGQNVIIAGGMEGRLLNPPA